MHVNNLSQEVEGLPLPHSRPRHKMQTSTPQCSSTDLTNAWPAYIRYIQHWEYSKEQVRPKSWIYDSICKEHIFSMSQNSVEQQLTVTPRFLKVVPTKNSEPQWRFAKNPNQSFTVEMQTVIQDGKFTDTSSSDCSWSVSAAIYYMSVTRPLKGALKKDQRKGKCIQQELGHWQARSLR